MNSSPLLSPADVVVLLIDPQPGLAFVVESQSRSTLENSLVAVAKTANAFKVPIVLTTSATKKYGGPVLTRLADVVNPVAHVERTSMNAWESEDLKKAIDATGRPVIVAAGLLTEACVAFTVLSALAEGRDVRVVVDACGARSPSAQETSVSLMMQAGMRPRTWLQFLLELQREWTHSETYAAATDVVKAHAGAYGMGLNYAKAMFEAVPK